MLFSGSKQRQFRIKQCQQFSARGPAWPGPAAGIASAGRPRPSLLIVAGVPGPGSGHHRKAVVHPPPSVTITTGNLTFNEHGEERPGGERGGPGGERAAPPWPGRSRVVPVDERPDLGISVTARQGALSRVTVIQRRRAGAWPGRSPAGASAWHTAWALAPSQTYRVHRHGGQRPGQAHGHHGGPSVR